MSDAVILYDEQEEIFVTPMNILELKELVAKDIQWEQKLDIVCDYLKALLSAKHHDYGPDNLLKYGFDGIIMSLSNKLARIETLLKHNMKNEVKDESLIDAFLDTAGYALQAVVLFKDLEERRKQQRDTKPSIAKILDEYPDGVTEVKLTKTEFRKLWHWCAAKPITEKDIEELNEPNFKMRYRGINIEKGY